MKAWRTLPWVVAALAMAAQTPKADLYLSGEVGHSTPAVPYGTLKGTTGMDFKGTALFPQASGVAEVKSKPGGSFIVAKFNHLPPASSFGGAFLTYVLWGISPEGRATNLGEVILSDGQGKLKTSDPLQTFGMLVTAEPYFAVTQPSDAVVLENAVRPDDLARIATVDIRYMLQTRGQYAQNLEAGEALAMDKKTPFDVYQARNAVRIAQSAGAPAYAKDAFDKSVADLRASEVEGTAKKARIMEARSSVQSAEDARLTSVRQQRIEQTAREAERAQSQVDSAKAAQAAALQQSVQAEADKRAALLLAARSDADKTAALGQADRANAHTAALQAQLLAQFSAILQTRATARGLIVNMTGVLFQNGKATVLPAGREKLAKIAGILSSHKGLMIEADGFTDSTGAADFNLRLSEHRAESARDYLVSQGVPSDAVSFKGFGLENPIASNATSSGRQENRRVELVVSGEGITTAPATGM